MTRKLLSAVAVMVAVFFTGSIVAQAAEVTFGGQIRPRYEVRHQSDSTIGVNNEVIQMRTRLNTSVKVDDNTSAFLQFQMNSTFGANGALPTSGPFSPNDPRTEVGLHQAYFTIKNLFGQNLTAKIGRQEVILDGHRLFGNTGWTHGSQSHDAAMFSHSHDKMTVLYVYSKLREGTTTQDEDNDEAHIVWANIKGLLGENSSTSGIIVLADIDEDKAAGAGSTDLWTIGARHAGGMGDISYRAEFYYQTGQSSDVDIAAYMFGGRVGYKASGVAMMPKVTLWVDYLSGDDLTDTTEFGAFNPLLDTGHKFYGLMDLFLAQQTLGLIDLAIKLAIQPMAKTTLKVDLHSFTSAEDDAAGNDDLGEEIDVTLIYKYSANVKLVAGFSYFFGDAVNFVGTNPSAGGVNKYDTSAGADDDASWAYIMADVKF